MENEENKGLIHKMASKDQLGGLDCVSLVNSSLELCHSSLSLSHSLGHLDFSWSTIVWSKERKERKEKEKQERNKERKVRLSSFSKNTCS